MNNIINSFNLRGGLCPKIWDNPDSEKVTEIKLNSDVRHHILMIAKEFIDSFNLPKLEVDDVLLTGSIANYNWSDYSDVDIHVVIDTASIDGGDELVKEFLLVKKSVYGFKHDIKLKDFDVEVYPQDINEKLDADGVYSVLYKKWLKIPNRDDFKFNKEAVLSKVKEFNSKLDEIKKTKDLKSRIEMISTIREKLRKYRKSGLESGGEYSTENLVFKYLRRTNFINQLTQIKLKSTDKLLSLNEQYEF